MQPLIMKYKAKLALCIVIVSIQVSMNIAIHFPMGLLLYAACECVYILQSYTEYHATYTLQTS